MKAISLRRLRSLTSVLFKDWWRYRRALAARDASYLALCNRNETLEAAPDAEGFRCNWAWTSDLHAPKHLPFLGLRLLRRALSDHPIVGASGPIETRVAPQISFIIGHRGMERLPHLLRTLQSIAGQQGVAVECLVVEQECQTRIAGRLPSWVRHIHTPPPAPEMPYCRSWAFNVGVQHARSAVLCLHDNDMLVPVDYASRILEHVRLGYELVNLKRFIFYLDEQHTAAIFSGEAGLLGQAPTAIVQNLEAGGSVAITREAFERIGGMDESFIGWGGEDNEFWERAQTLRVWPYAYLPLVHQWHAPQSSKDNAARSTLKHYEYLSGFDARARISRLRTEGSGALSGPTGWKPPAAADTTISQCAE